MIWLIIAASGGRVLPTDYELKEYWTWKPPGDTPWIVRVLTGRRYWEDKQQLKDNPGFPHSESGPEAEDSGSSVHRRYPNSSPEKLSGGTLPSPPHGAI